MFHLLSLGWQSPWATVAALISNPKALGMMCHIGCVSTLVTFTALIIYMIYLTAPAKGHWITINGLTVRELFIYYKVFNCIFSCRSIIKTVLIHIWPLHWSSPLCLLPFLETFGGNFKVKNEDMNVTISCIITVGPPHPPTPPSLYFIFSKYFCLQTTQGFFCCFFIFFQITVTMIQFITVIIE